MQLKFLSPGQRVRLGRDQHDAERFFLRSAKQAMCSLDAGESAMAFDYAGKALEAARLLVMMPSGCSRASLQRYTDGAILMQHSLRAVGYQQLIRPFYAKFMADMEGLFAKEQIGREVFGFCQQLIESDTSDASLATQLASNSTLHAAGSTQNLH